MIMKCNIMVHDKTIIRAKMNTLNVNEQIILLTKEYWNILLAYTISLAASVMQRYTKFIHYTYY